MINTLTKDSVLWFAIKDKQVIKRCTYPNATVVKFHTTSQYVIAFHTRWHTCRNLSSFVSCSRDLLEALRSSISLICPSMIPLWTSSHSVIHFSSASTICIIRRSSPSSTTRILLYLSEILSLKSAADFWNENTQAHGSMIQNMNWKIWPRGYVTWIVPLFVSTVTPSPWWRVLLDIFSAAADSEWSLIRSKDRHTVGNKHSYIEMQYVWVRNTIDKS